MLIGELTLFDDHSNEEKEETDSSADESEPFVDYWRAEEVVSAFLKRCTVVTHAMENFLTTELVKIKTERMVSYIY